MRKNVLQNERFCYCISGGKNCMISFIFDYSDDERIELWLKRLEIMGINFMRVKNKGDAWYLKPVHFQLDKESPTFKTDFYAFLKKDVYNPFIRI